MIVPGIVYAFLLMHFETWEERICPNLVPQPTPRQCLIYAHSDAAERLTHEAERVLGRR